MLSFTSNVLAMKLVGIILMLTSLLIVYQCSEPNIISKVGKHIFISLIMLCSVGLILGYLLLTIEFWRVLFV